MIVATYCSFSFYLLSCENEERSLLENSSNLALNFAASWTVAKKLFFAIDYLVSVILD